MFRPAKELIEGCTTATRDLARQICHDTLAENAEETVANLILVAYLVTLADNDIRPQDTNKEDDFSLVDQCLSVISKQIDTIKYTNLLTQTAEKLQQRLTNELPEKWA